jgi:hypothetical protein
MIMSKYDDEIRVVEERLVREREALAHQAQRLGQKARTTATSPKGLLVAGAIGFLIGELSRPRHHHHHSAPSSTQTKIGLGSVIGGVALALMRAQYGSPLGFGRAALQYAADRRRAAQAASDRAAREAEAGGAARTRDAADASAPIGGAGAAETARQAAGMKEDDAPFRPAP